MQFKHWFFCNCLGPKTQPNKKTITFTEPCASTAHKYRLFKQFNLRCVHIVAIIFISVFIMRYFLDVPFQRSTCPLRRQHNSCVVCALADRTILFNRSTDTQYFEPKTEYNQYRSIISLLCD